MRDYWRGDASIFLVFVGKQQREATVELSSILFLRMTVHERQLLTPRLRLEDEALSRKDIHSEQDQTNTEYEFHDDEIT